MAEKSLPVKGNISFEDLKSLNEHGAEFWSARELQPLLGYSQWRRFEDAIDRAMMSCKQSGNNPDYHFAGAGKMIGTGKGAVREVTDFHLSRFACYLIAQNGDPRKAEIAAARGAGVQDRMFGIFHDAGYKGLYDALGNAAIKQKKDIPKKENLMDRMDTTELAANQFRMTQTRDKLAQAQVKDQLQAIRTHETVGKEVREAIKRIGGVMPENIPPAEHISKVEKRIKDTPPLMELEEKDEKGLIGEDEG
jgi:DNA-damage-inducible protein D